MIKKPFLCLSLVFAGLLVHVGFAQMPPPLPVINTTNVFNITSYGATTSSTDNSAAISNAIAAAHAASGGGMVEIPSGTFMSGPISMLSSVDLQLDSGATLKFLTESSYPGASGTPVNPITASSVTNFEFTGSGTIDGNGSSWWHSSNSGNAPYMIYCTKCLRVLFQGITLQNSPKMHVSFKSWMGYVTFQGITINTPVSPNTDGIDLIGTNCIVENCHIADGDDNIAIGSSSASAHSYNIVVTNCNFGIGHGVSIGSNTAGGVSNLTVINCVWNGTDFGIRMKSDDETSGSTGAGGTSQDLNYYNLNMTNVTCPLLIFSYYATLDSQGNDYYPPMNDDITPTVASTQAVGNLSIPVWKNIVISNLLAVSSGESLIWGRIETPVTNISLIDFRTQSPSSSSSYNFGIYNAYGVNIINSSIGTASGLKTFSLYNAGVTISNETSSFTMDGLTSANSLALYKNNATIGASDLYGANPITVSGCVLSDSTDLSLPSTTIVNFNLGTTPSTVSISGSLTLSSPTLNILTNNGFGAGTYTLFTYTGSLSGSATLGTTPSGYTCTLTNNTSAKQYSLLVTSTGSSGTKPTVTNQPASHGFYTGQNVTFASGASGTAPLAYQWYFNTNSVLPAATNASLSITNLQTTNTGTYDMIVTNAYGSDTSAVVSLTVILPPNLASAALNSSGGNLVVSGTGGLPGSNYIVLTTTNVTLPSSQWTPVATNTFNGTGGYSFTNGTAGGNPQNYFRLRFP
jgi:hypothetical protein